MSDRSDRFRLRYMLNLATAYLMERSLTSLTLGPQPGKVDLELGCGGDLFLVQLAQLRPTIDADSAVY